ncbi:ubiquitin domain-containing protein DSK2b-like [Solanum dulcamara]|uniref:ubiquitin domain-containing protein DSK2b-like n=1 Tax=Solanum dulcamara TaxID=45834 RepID=UPI002486815B|nr:ubiquitin domain-containing protein DSK2b-like [Solanum dulcamara]
MGGGDNSAAAAKEDNENNATGDQKVTINVRCSNGSKFSVQVTLDSSVGSFKSTLSQHSDIPAEQQRLIYKGRILKDEQTLASYGLEEDHTVHLVRGFAPAAAVNTASAVNTGNPNANQNAPSDAAPNVGGPFAGSGLGASLFPGLGSGGSGGGLLGAGLPDFEQVQQQLTQNPNMMRDMLNMPLVQNLMNNPDIIRNMIMNNPQMREIMDRNPELAHVLNDPATLRQTMEAARNPELMREMMRNTDRAMSNIESSPEGFNMLRRMYENVQEPFLNATTMGGDARSDVGSNPFAALLGAQGAGQGRDQSTNPPTTGSEATANTPAPNTNPLPNPWASAGTGAGQTNTTARSNTAGETRAPPPSGLGGLVLPDLEGMLGGMPDAASLNQMMQNPAVSQMMQSLLSNPQYMNQMLGMNPQLRNMLDSNSHLREMMQNPEFIRQMTSPETMQQLMTFQQGLLSQLGRQPTNQPGQNAGGAALDNNMGMEMLMNMFGGLGSGGLGGVPNRSNVPPEELYATQLAQLQDMGFFDTQENIRALVATAGNVHAAVERLLGNLGQ